MATLKDFEEALQAQGMTTALAILADLRKRDRAIRVAAPARRITGQKMTPDLAQRIRDLHGSTTMTQQEIAFKVGVNQGRVNEVIKRGKWLDGNPAAPEAQARDKALARLKAGARKPSPLRKRDVQPVRRPPGTEPSRSAERPAVPPRRQLSFADWG